MEEHIKKHLEKRNHLKKLAEEDEVYLLWKEIWERNAAPFERFANLMPRRIRNILWGYADGGRIAMQRLSNIACECMDFNGEEPGIWNRIEKE